MTLWRIIHAIIAACGLLLVLVGAFDENSGSAMAIGSMMLIEAAFFAGRSDPQP